MTTGQVVVVVALRCRDHKAPPNGSERVPVIGGCFECGLDVWLTEHTMDHAVASAQEQGASVRVMCSECGGAS